MNLISLIMALMTLVSSLFTSSGTPETLPEIPNGIVLEAESAAGTESAAVSADDTGLVDELLRRAREAARQETVRVRSSIPFRDMTYVHYDPETFYLDCDRLCELAQQGLADEVAELYDQLYEEYLYVDTLSVLAMLEHDLDIYDEYWTAENAYSYTLSSDLWDAFLCAAGDVLETSCAKAFSKHVGRDMTWLLRYYEPDDSESRLQDERLLALMDEYELTLDTADTDVTYKYLGETWTVEKLYGFPGTALASTNYDGYIEVFSGLHKALAERFAPLYIELIGLWKQEALDAGYDSYVEYAYEAVYGRDYSAEDAQRFCDAVKPLAREYYEDLYYSDLYYEADETSPTFTGAELIALLGDYLPRIDEHLTEPWADMTERGLYDIRVYNSGRYNGSYTTIMLYYQAPFLFASLMGDCSDLTTITHEFGHFCDYWSNPQTNIFTQIDSLDLSEIHSNALQALFTNFYGEIYTSGADAAEFINLSDLLENVFEGCLYDEFQRRVLSETEELTPEKLNDIYLAVTEEYGLGGEWSWDSSWVYVPHNFERPLYYISYAASAIPALQIWDMSQTDVDKAVDAYLGVLAFGSYEEEYAAVLRSVGLRLFSEEGAAAEICRPVLDRLEALDRQHH